MSNKIKTLALLPIISLVLTACTVQDLPLLGKYFTKKPSEPVELKIWGLWEDPKVLNVLFENYKQQQSNVTVAYEDRSIMDPVEYKERVATRLYDGTGLDADIVLIHNSWVPLLKDYLTPMPQELLSSDDYATKFYPSATESAVINGNIYAIPAYYDGLVLVYNKKHFAEIGQRFAPTSWEEFRVLALNLTKRSGEDNKNIDRGGAAIGTADNIDFFSDIIGLLWAQASVSIPSQIDSRAAQDALTYYTDLSREYKIWDNSLPEATQAFIEGKASMVFVPSWKLLDIVSSMPDVNDIGVAPVPQARADTPASWGSFWMFAVPNTSAHPDVAWDLINNMVSEDQQLAYFNEVSKYRVFGPPFALSSLAPQISNPLLKPLLDMAPYSKSAEIADRAGNRKQVTSLKDAVNAVISGSLDVSSALQKAKQDMQ